MGEGITPEEEELLSRRVLLTERCVGLPVDRLQYNLLEIINMFSHTPVPQLHWEDDRGTFLQQCVKIVNEFAPRIPPCINYNADFRNHQERCPMAVCMALPTRVIQAPAALLVPWMNHHGTYTIAELRAANIANPRLKVANARRRFSCWLEFSHLPTQLASAQLPLTQPKRPGSKPGIA